MTSSNTLINDVLDTESTPPTFTSIRFAAIKAKIASHQSENEKFNTHYYDETGLDTQSQLIAKALDNLIDSIVYLERELLIRNKNQDATLKKLSNYVASYSDCYIAYKNNANENNYNNLLLASSKLVAMRTEIETTFKENKYLGAVTAGVCLLGLATFIGGFVILATAVTLSLAAVACSALFFALGGSLAINIPLMVCTNHYAINTKIKDITTNLNLLGRQHAFFQAKKESADLQQNTPIDENSIANRKS